MELQYLRYFCHLAKSNHLTRTANDLRISQPSLTQYIKRLEGELGVRLFDRRGRNIQLNSYGELLLEYAGPIVALMDEAQAKIKQARSVESSIVTVYAPPAVYTELAILIKHHMPDIALNSAPFAPLQSIRKGLLSNDIDLCIQPPAFRTEGLGAAALHMGERVLLLSRDIWPGEEETVSLSDFREFDFVAYDTGTASGLEFERICSAAGFEPKVKYVSSLYEIIEYVKTGLFIALVPESILYKYKTEDLVRLYLSDVDTNTALCLFWNENAPKRMSVTLVRDFIIENLKNV